MKKFNEWRSDMNESIDPSILIEKISELVNQLHMELKSFQGERFEGFLNLCGDVTSLQRTVLEIEHGIVGETPKFATEDCGEPHAPRKMQKINRKEIISKGTRNAANDLSSDYKGNVKMNGDVEPFRVMKKK